MTRTPELHTARLLLRGWRDDDADAFAEMNADPRVVEHLPSALTREESDTLLGLLRAHFATHGFGMWAVEIPGIAPLAGLVGLNAPTFVTDFTPCVEVGWRLLPAHWGHGYAREAARASLDFAFDALRLPEVLAWTVPDNTRSRRVMEAIGMRHTGDFDHPRLPEGHRLRRHVLYRIAAPPT